MCDLDMTPFSLKVQSMCHTFRANIHESFRKGTKDDQAYSLQVGKEYLKTFEDKGYTNYMIVGALRMLAETIEVYEM